MTCPVFSLVRASGDPLYLCLLAHNAMLAMFFRRWIIRIDNSSTHCVHGTFRVTYVERNLEALGIPLLVNVEEFRPLPHVETV